MSAVINPFIYAFKNRQYKQAFKKVLENFLDYISVGRTNTDN